MRLGIVLVALDDGHVDTAEWVKPAIAALGTLGVVWAVPNAPTAPAVKRG